MLKQALGVLILAGSLALAGCATGTGHNGALRSVDTLAYEYPSDVDMLVADAVSEMHRYTDPSDGKLYLLTVPGNFGSKFKERLMLDGYTVETLSTSISQHPADGRVLAYTCEILDDLSNPSATARINLSNGQHFAVARHLTKVPHQTKVTPQPNVATQPVTENSSYTPRYLVNPIAEVRDWSLTASELRPQMENWCKSVGYELVWKLGNTIKMETPFKYTGTFVDFLNVLFEGLHAAGHPFLVTVYEGNNIVTVESK